MKVDTSGLRKVKPIELAFRFIFGGTVCAATGWVAHRFGPLAAGLFLSFPAILPASLTLVMSHEGRKQSIDDGTGAAAGSAGMIAFGLCIWKLAPALSPGLTLASAAVSWLAVALVVWKLALADGEVR